MASFKKSQAQKLQTPNVGDKKKRLWFGKRRNKNDMSPEQNSMALNVDSNDLSIKVSADSMVDRDPSPSNVVDFVSHVESENRKVLETEQSIQRQIREATMKKDVRLQNSGGVLLFDGMQEHDVDEYTKKEVYATQGIKTDFLNVPTQYDPVKSGFMAKSKKKYYDSDDDEQEVTQTNEVAPSTGFMCCMFGS